MLPLVPTLLQIAVQIYLVNLLTQSFTKDITALQVEWKSEIKAAIAHFESEIRAVRVESKSEIRAALGEFKSEIRAVRVESKSEIRAALAFVSSVLSKQH